MMPNDPLVGGVALRRPAIQSPNFLTGVEGWTINADGSVEFNSGVFRGTVTAGTFEGVNFEINQAGAFFYDGTPANGNLIVSIAASAGSDSHGNMFPRGVMVGDSNSSSRIKLLPGISGQASEILLDSATANLSNYPNIASGLGGSSSNMVISGPALVTVGDEDWVQFFIVSNDGAGNAARCEFRYIDTNGVVSVMGKFTGTGWTFGGGATVNGTVSGIQVPITAVTQSSPTISTTTYTNIGTAVNLGVGTYVIEARIFWHPNGTIGGNHTHGFNYSGSASSAAWNGVANQANSTSGINQSTGQNTNVPSVGNVDVVSSPTHLNFYGWTEIYGYLVTTSSGTLNAVCKIGTSGDTVQILAGSLLRVTQIA